MSSSRHHHGHSHRSSSHRRDSNLAVTESLEGLSLGGTANAYSSSDYPSYSSAYSLPVADDQSFVPDVLDMPYYHESLSSHPQSYAGGQPHGFTYPTTEVPLSRSIDEHQSHLLPANILPSSFEEEFAGVDRDIGRLRRHRHIARARRKNKTRARRAVMQSPGEGDDHGSSLAGELSSSIDDMTAHHPPAHGGPGYGSYTSPDPNRSMYTSSAAYDYPTSLYTSAPAYQPSFSTAHGDYQSSRSSRHAQADLGPGPVPLSEPRRPQCWDHGCNGRTFSTFSNLLRHQREKSGTSSKASCPSCGAEFTRKTARDGHIAQNKCKGGRKSNN